MHSQPVVPTHAPVQTAPLDTHCALALQVCGWLALQRDLPGVHSPPHEPLLLLQRYGHGVPFAQLPLLLHVCGVRPLHCRSPGLHVVHFAEMHAYWQTWLMTHWPELLQMAVTGAMSLARRPHDTALGLQTPVHELTPPVVVQTDGQAELCHWPLASQVCSVAPEHCVVPGVHIPLHFPPLHT
jgi:hypothetical protein